MKRDTITTQGGLPCLHLETDSGAQTDIFLQGAHVARWQPAGATHNRLFMSEASHFASGVAIRGGVPVIFPQFAGRGPLPKHGFARTSEWQLLSHGQLDEHTAQAVFTLNTSDHSRAQWPYNFAVNYIVTLQSHQLDMQLKVVNTGTRPLSFTAALHTYFQVGDVRETRLHGLQGSRWETPDGGFETETQDVLTVRQPIDRIFHQTPASLTLESPAQRTEIRAEGFEDTVVWNPWADASAAMDDMTDDGYEQMLCVEAAAAIEPISLTSNESWSGRQTLVALDLPKL